jgi:hypothetical protein
MKRFLCSALISIASILLVPQVGRSADDGLCFLRTESGKIIGLDALCFQRSQEKPMEKPNDEEVIKDLKAQPKLTAEDVIKDLKAKFPGFYTYDDLSPELKAMADREGGMANLRFTPENVTPGKPIILPNGDRVESDGSTITMVKKSGFRFSTVKDESNPDGFRFKMVKPDGTELKPGEVYNDPDGFNFMGGN